MRQIEKYKDGCIDRQMLGLRFQRTEEGSIQPACKLDQIRLPPVLQALQEKAHTETRNMNLTTLSPKENPKPETPDTLHPTRWMATRACLVRGSCRGLYTSGYLGFGVCGSVWA